MKEKLKQIPVLFIDVINSLLTGLKSKVSNTKGVLSLMFFAFILLDFLCLGKIGLLNFCLDIFKDIFVIISDLIVKAGWKVAIIIGIIVLLIDRDKK